MKIIPKTKKDFEWVNWGPKEIEKSSKSLIEVIKKDYEKIKSIPKKDRTFENTVCAIESAGGDASEDNPIFALKYLSPKKTVREASKKASEFLSKELVDLNHDKALYNAFLEYRPRKEKLTDEEKLLWKDIDTSFRKMGFHLSKDDQKKLTNLRKRVSKLGIEFSSNIDNYQDKILCSKEDLSGLPDNYISNLSKDNKTKKYIVSLSYPEAIPFLTFADSDKKRKELADKLSQKGGKKNIKILSEILIKRKEISSLMGYKSYADYLTEDRIVSSSKTVRGFIEDTLNKTKPAVKQERKELETFSKKDLGMDLNYYSSAYCAQKLKEKQYKIDDNKIKEYFALDSVMEYMFSLFGGLFGISFKKNNKFPVWHKDVIFYDIYEKSKVVAHIGFDLFPRKDKYSHAAAHFTLFSGHKSKFRGSKYLSPVSLIVGNFPRGTKKNPSLLSFREVETMFHEFGHACHNFLTRASFDFHSGTSTDFDFVETPSQLLENWVNDKEILRSMSSHYKTGERLSVEMVDSIIRSTKFRQASSSYGQLLYALQDNLMHTTEYKTDPLVLDKKLDKKYKTMESSPKSLFPAGFSHLYDYGASYYTYMWSLVYAYDIFSRFKKEGIKNKKVGKELREKILSKGGSVDEMKQMKDFLGRKPNNKAFLEALGIK